jgi:hypothetical protein
VTDTEERADGAAPLRHVRDHYLPPDRAAYRRAEPSTGRVIVIAPTRAACETIELACGLTIDTVLSRAHGDEVRSLAAGGRGFGIVAGTGTGKTLAVRLIAEETVGTPLRIGVVNREREATPETPSWNVVIVTTGIARRWFQDDLIQPQDTLVVDEIHQTSAELELCLALGKRVGCRFIWLSATVDPSFYERYLDASAVLETSAFDPALSANVATARRTPVDFFDRGVLRRFVREERGVAVFLPTRSEVEKLAAELGDEWPEIATAFYHGGEPIRVIRPFLEGTAERPYLLVMTQAGQSALNIHGLDTVVIYDACYQNRVLGGRNVLQRQYLGPNEILQMAGRVHGRVAQGEVHILTDRDIDFFALEPVPPQFQLAGDSERVALTAAALGVDLSDLELPVPLDRRAYRAARRRLEDRGIVDGGRLTAYGREVEAMPVDRPWAELLVHASDALAPYVAVAASVDSLHRMTRDLVDLRGLEVYGSDHLTVYNVYAEAVNLYGSVGEVYGLPRHVFDPTIEEWAQDRGVLVKAIEDAALGMASVYRTLELPLPEALPIVDRAAARAYRDLVARVCPFDLVVDGETADGSRVRISDSSMCSRGSAVAGPIRYFADRFGRPRGAIEGTTLSRELMRRHATREGPVVEYRGERGRTRLVAVETLTYAGFTLDRISEPVRGFPEDLAEEIRGAMADGLMRGVTEHPGQREVGRVAARIDEYWRRSGGTLDGANPERVRAGLLEQLSEVKSHADFMAASLHLDLDAAVLPRDRHPLDALPDSAFVLGDRVPLRYDVAEGRPIVELALREKQARRLRAQDLPDVDRDLVFVVYRGRTELLRARSLPQLRGSLRGLRPPLRGGGGGRSGRGGRGGRSGRGGRGRRRR